MISKTGFFAIWIFFIITHAFSVRLYEIETGRIDVFGHCCSFVIVIMGAYVLSIWEKVVF